MLVAIVETGAREVDEWIEESEVGIVVVYCNGVDFWKDVSQGLRELQNIRTALPGVQMDGPQLLVGRYNRDFRVTL